LKIACLISEKSDFKHLINSKFSQDSSKMAAICGRIWSWPMTDFSEIKHPILKSLCKVNYGIPGRFCIVLFQDSSKMGFVLQPKLRRELILLP
jgi:hypothetical protein